MPHQVEKLTASLISESRKGKIEMRQKALHVIKELVNNSNKDTLQLLSLPSTAWLFEGQALRYIKSNDKNAVLHAFENNYKLYVKLCKEVFNIECTNKNVIQPDSHWRVKGSYRDIPVMLHNINVLNYLKNKKETFDFMWLDLMSPIDCISSYLSSIEEKTNPDGVVILSFIKGREKSKISDRVEYVMNHLKNMDLFDRYDYNDTSPMVNIFLRKRLTRQDLENTIYLGPETQTQTTNTIEQMVNSENNSEKAPVAKTIAIAIEKLEGGYIANPGGKRRIFEKAEDIMDTIGVNKILSGMENTEYHLDIRLTPKGEYLEADALVAILDGHPEEELTLESARANGMIEKETFNPVKAPVEPDLSAPIKAVTAITAYSPERLQAIDWAGYHKQLHMEPVDIARETGLNVTSLYNCLPKVRAGSFGFKNTKTRIGFTVLAQLYERVLNIRTTTKEKHELMKENLLKSIREIELMSNGKSHMKCSDVIKKLVEMRKELL